MSRKWVSTEFPDGSIEHQPGIDLESARNRKQLIKRCYSDGRVEWYDTEEWNPTEDDLLRPRCAAALQLGFWLRVVPELPHQEKRLRDALHLLHGYVDATRSLRLLDQLCHCIELWQERRWDDHLKDRGINAFYKLFQLSSDTLLLQDGDHRRWYELGVALGEANAEQLMAGDDTPSTTPDVEALLVRLYERRDNLLSVGAHQATMHLEFDFQEHGSEFEEELAAPDDGVFNPIVGTITSESEIAQRNVVRDVEIDLGDEEYILQAPESRSVKIKGSEARKLFACFAAKVCSNGAGESVPWPKLNDAVNAGTAEDSASPKLRRVKRRLLVQLMELGSTPDNKPWIDKSRGEGYSLNDSVNWTATDKVHDILNPESPRTSTTSKPRTLEENTPDRDSSLPARPRRKKLSDSSEADWD